MQPSACVEKLDQSVFSIYPRTMFHLQRRDYMNSRKRFVPELPGIMQDRDCLDGTQFRNRFAHASGTAPVLRVSIPVFVASCSPWEMESQTRDWWGICTRRTQDE